MAATPPPPKRIHTPPTPLHGLQHDTYEPYSPRRSTRIAKQYSNHSSPNRSWNSASSSSAAINSARSASGTFSPPQSPLSPVKRLGAVRGGKLDVLTPRKQRRVQIFEDRDSESDAAAAASQFTGISRATQMGAGMLPTPSKTPKKRVVSQEVVQSTSRVLFPGRLANPDDAMPPTRKSRKNKIFSLDGLDEDGDDEAGRISIYTDSKDRVPDLDEGEDNPFVTKKGKKSKVNGSVEDGTRGVTRRSSRRANGYDEEIEEMERKVQNEEGMIYVFRGRKVFRRFDNTSTEDTVAGTPTNGGSYDINELIKRKAGAAANERFTRSTMKPRLLFPNAEQQREREERARREEEEAITDIEVHEDEDMHLQANDTADEATVTPVKDNFDRPATPPQTGSTKRRAYTAAQQVLDESATAATVAEEGESANTRATKSHRAKVSPFDSWQRTKASTRASHKGTKREREVEISDSGTASSGKRARSGTVTQPLD